MSQPSNDSPTSSRPSAPLGDGTDHLKELALQLTPSQSERFVRNVRRLCLSGSFANSLQVRQKLLDAINDQATVITSLKRKMEDVVNAANDPRTRKKDSRNHREIVDEDLPPGYTAAELQARARAYGRKFVILGGLGSRSATATLRPSSARHSTTNTTPSCASATSRTRLPSARAKSGR
jgi:hypothetical protein